MKFSILTQLPSAILSLSGLATALPVEASALDSVERATGQPLLRIMALGASITAGSTSNPMDGYRKQLRRLLRSAGYQVNFVGSQTNRKGSMKDGQHEGYPGKRIKQVSDELHKNGALRFKPNVVLLHAGTNNCIQNHDVTTTYFTQIVDGLFTDIPGVAVVVSTLGVLKDEDSNNRCQNILNPAIRRQVEKWRAAKKNIHFVDIAANRGYSIADIGKDHIHPTAGGYNKLAQMWFEKIEAVHKVNLIHEAAKTRFPDDAQDD